MGLGSCDTSVRCAARQSGFEAPGITHRVTQQPQRGAVRTRPPAVRWQWAYGAGPTAPGPAETTTLLSAYPTRLQPGPWRRTRGRTRAADLARSWPCQIQVWLQHVAWAASSACALLRTHRLHRSCRPSLVPGSDRAPPSAHWAMEEACGGTCAASAARTARSPAQLMGGLSYACRSAGRCTL